MENYTNGSRSFFYYLGIKNLPQQTRKLKLFFVLVVRLVLRSRSLCTTECDTKNWGYKSFGVPSPLSLKYVLQHHYLRWLQEIALKMHELRELLSQTDLVGTQNTYLCKLHFIKTTKWRRKILSPIYMSHIWSCAARLFTWWVQFDWRWIENEM